MKTLSSLNFQLTELCNKPREQALAKLAKVRAANTPNELAIAAKKLSVFYRHRIKDYVQTLNNRRDNPTLGSLSLGDKVRYIGGEYTSIANEILTIVEFNEGAVYCTRLSGSYAPIVFPGELKKC
jgi:hypothetical protein